MQVASGFKLKHRVPTLVYLLSSYFKPFNTHGRDKHNTSEKNVIFEFSQYFWHFSFISVFENDIPFFWINRSHTKLTNSIFIHVLRGVSMTSWLIQCNGILIIGSVSRYHLYYVTLKQWAIIRLIGLSDYQREIPPMSPGVNINRNE